MVTRKELGNRGEEEACTLLQKNGYRIITRNFRCREGEIDIVASEGGEIVFVEVRTRSSLSQGSPEESITLQKRTRLRKVALAYLTAAGNSLKARGYRFDVVTFRLKGNELEPNLIKGAF